MRDLSRRDYERILMVKPSSFGDVIHALPVLSGLRQRYPHARISWLVATSCAGLLEGHPALDEIIRWDRQRYGLIGLNSGATGEFLAFVRGLRARRFEVALDLQGLFRSGLLTLASGAPIRLGFAPAREMAGMFYTDRVAATDREMHAVDRNYLFGRALGFADVPVTFDLPVSSQARSAMQRTLRDHGIAPQERYALMGPGTRWETKLWPARSFAEAAARIESELGLRVVLIGMQAEVQIARQVAALAGPRVVNLAGRTSLPELIALVAGATLAVMHDSGPMHLATALNTPMVAIYGPTNPRRTGPYRRAEAIVRLDLPCSPCYLKRVADCPHQHRCMRELLPQEVWVRASRILAQQSGAHDAGCIDHAECWPYGSAGHRLRSC